MGKQKLQAKRSIALATLRVSVADAGKGGKGGGSRGATPLLK